MELLVRTFDKYTGADVRLQSKTTVRGDVIAVQQDASGVVNTDGIIVIKTSGDDFKSSWKTIVINGVAYPIGQFNSSTSIVLAKSAGVQAGSSYRFIPYWGPCELKNPAYVILRVPVSETEARAMLTPELGDPLAKPLLQVREFHIDLDALALLGYKIPNQRESREARYPNGEDRQDYLKLPDSPIIEVKAVDFQSCRARKKPLVDPLVIG